MKKYHEKSSTPLPRGSLPLDTRNRIGTEVSKGKWWQVVASGGKFHSREACKILPMQIAKKPHARTHGEIESRGELAEW